MALKRVVHVFGSLNMGGAESRIMDVYRKLDRTVIQFDFVTLDTSLNQYFEQEINELGGHIYKIPSPREIGIINHFKQLQTLFRLLNEKGDLIVHAHTLHHCGVTLLAAKLADVNVRIAHARSTCTRHTGIGTKINVLMGRMLIRFFATHKLAISEEAASFLYGENWKIQSGILVLPNAINLDLYREDQSEAIIRLQQELNIPKGKKILGHVGRFESMKNHRFLISLFADYHKENPDSVLVLVGDGSLFNEIRTKVEEAELSSAVFFTGIRKDVHLLINLFDLIIMPSIYEGLCSVVIEAQAAGKPCLVSEGIPESADLQLGIVYKLNLNCEKRKWVAAIDYQLTIPSLSIERIMDSFNARGLTLESEIRMLYNIYK